MSDDQVWHYLTPQDALRYPRRHIFLDTETVSRTQRGAQVLTWRVGVTAARWGGKGRPQHEQVLVHNTPADLWSYVDGFTKAKSRTILWSHNLGFDVRVSDAFTVLARLGWRLVAFNMAPAGTWLVLACGNRTLTMVDSASVFPMRIKDLAPHFATTKLPLPATNAPLDQWVRRCLRDVQIMRDAVVAYLSWIETERLGSWALTGTGQAWAAFRSRFLTHKMLVHWDEDARAAEREAAWCGRTEAYWHGTLHHKRIDEWDMAQAYPQIAKDHPVPTELVKTLPAGSQLGTWLADRRYAVLARVTVRTEVETVPAAHEGRILWPVGDFETTLWDPELRLLVDHGGSYQVQVAWVYRAEPALHEWAVWVLDLLNDTGTSRPAWVRLIAKHWSRAVIGRMAMHHRQWDYVGQSRRTDWRWSPCIDRDTGEVSELVQVGRDLWESGPDVDWSSSMPAITGWVASQCRAMITQGWLAAGVGRVLYMDTDSMITTGDHYDAMVKIAKRHPHLRLRRKRSWNRITIYGPRAIVTGNKVRVSGIPSRARQLADGTMVGEVWQSLRGSMRDGTPARIRVTPRTWRLRELTKRRSLGPDGWTQPIRLPTA